MMAVLRKQKTRQAQMRLAAGPAWENRDGLVFTNEFGGHLAHSTVFKDFKAIVRGIGLERARFHDLRHPNVKHKTQISREIFKIFSDTKAVGSYSIQKSFIFQTIST